MRTKEAGPVHIVIPSTKRVLQHNITAKRTKEAGLVLIVIPTTKREKLAEKAKPVFAKSSTTKTWVSKIQKVPWTLMVLVGLSQRFKNRFNIMISINDIEKTVKVTQQRKFSSILFSVDALLTSDSSNLVPK